MSRGMALVGCFPSLQYPVGLLRGFVGTSGPWCQMTGKEAARGTDFFSS
jgi:hypothetical protein